MDSLESLSARIAKLEDRTKTQLLDTRLMVRAFAVYGHYLLAGLIIGGSILLMMGMFGMFAFFMRVMMGRG